MDLGIDLFRTTGRAAKPVTAEIVRELKGGDLVLLSEEKGVKPSAIKRLSDRHHSLARSLASGMSPSQAGLTCGYSLSRVSILQDDPTFQELLRFYRADVDAQYLGLHEQLSAIAKDAVAEIADRLEDAPQDISLGQLLEIAKMGADRTGHGPSTSQTVNLNVNLADRLQRARERVATRIIEG